MLVFVKGERQKAGVQFLSCPGKARINVDQDLLLHGPGIRQLGVNSLAALVHIFVRPAAPARQEQHHFTGWIKSRPSGSSCPLYEAPYRKRGKLGTGEGIWVIDDDLPGREIQAHFQRRGCHQHLGFSILEGIFDKLPLLLSQSGVMTVCRNPMRSKELCQGLYPIPTVAEDQGLPAFCNASPDLLQD